MEDVNKKQKIFEPLLMPSNDRFVGQSKNYPEVAKMTDKLLSLFWAPNIISLKQDVVDWGKMSDKERSVIKRIHAFFAAADGIVNENIAGNFLARIQTSEHRSFYEAQIGNEVVHKITYANIITTLVPNTAELNELLGALDRDPIIKKKAAWAMKFMDPNGPLADQILAFACVEGIQFCSSFLTIFYFKNRSLLPGVSNANEYISRDESLHTIFATHTYLNDITERSTREVEIIQEAVDLECEFVTDMLGEDGLPGFATKDVHQYVKMVADRICRDIGIQPIYGAKNPFPFMDMINFETRKSFFERASTDYIGRGAIENDPVLVIDNSF